MTETARQCMECQEVRPRATGCQCPGYVCSECCECGAAERELIVQVDKPFSVKDFIDKGRAAGHDALGIANDPEAIAALDAAKNAPTSLAAAAKARELVAMPPQAPVNHHTREPNQPSAATIVELVKLWAEPEWASRASGTRVQSGASPR